MKNGVRRTKLHQKHVSSLFLERHCVFFFSPNSLSLSLSLCVTWQQFLLCSLEGQKEILPCCVARNACAKRCDVRGQASGLYPLVVMEDCQMVKLMKRRRYEHISRGTLEKKKTMIIMMNLQRGQSENLKT